MKLLLFIMLTISLHAVSISVPKSFSTSRAYFSSVSNTNIATTFLTCGTYDYLWDLHITAKSALSIDLCAVSGVTGLCTTEGSVSNSTVLTYSTNSIIILGYTNGSYDPSEVGTGTKFTGDFVAKRRCVSKDFVR